MRKNIASQHIAGQMNSASTGAPLTTGVTVYLQGDGAAQAAGAGVATHLGNGSWDYAPTQAETNYNHVAFVYVHATGVNQTVNVYTTAADPADGSTLGLSGLALSTQVDTLEGLISGTISLGAGGTLAIGATGATVVNTGTVLVGDKTGFSLVQSFPTNFSATLIDAAGTVTTQAAGASVTVGSFAPSAAGQISTAVDASTSVVAIKAKTDSLTFTVANQVDSNTESINATTIIGAGVDGNKFRV